VDIESRKAGERPVLALTAGDPSGIGPEIVAAALADPDVRAAVRLVAVGPESACPPGVEPYDASTGAQDVAWLTSDDDGGWSLGSVSASGGRAALAALRAGVDLVKSGGAQALVTAPVCKEALHLAGEPVEGQTELLARWDAAEPYEMVAEAGDLRVMLLTRHMPLRAALDAIDGDVIVDHLVLFDRALRAQGIERPHLGIAGLNPHAGEGGLLGHDEQRVITPAVHAARKLGIDVGDPRSPDMVFLEGARGDYDGVLALYHDQAFIPLKLLSEGRGLTWIAGLSFLRMSPVHGTAFDIAGRGVADPENLVHVLQEAGRRVRSGRETG
jgi:4-phospho-D-threonate 3-dehydrogenase / 4-phospho-D-erythronate 3-dehydrogenase